MHAVSVINLASVRDLERRTGLHIDARRFRANVYVHGLPPFSELDLVTVPVETVRLLYPTRSRAHTAYLEEFEAQANAPCIHLHDDVSGLVDLWPHLAEPGNTQLYCCGPTPLLDEVLALTMHWRPSSVHYEQFSGVAGVSSASVAFQARWESTGRSSTSRPTRRSSTL